jgi:hypothetical protein
VGEPPDPIPNSEVKPYSADNTSRETVREGRTLPGIKIRTAPFEKIKRGCLLLFDPGETRQTVMFKLLLARILCFPTFPLLLPHVIDVNYIDCGRQLH